MLLAIVLFGVTSALPLPRCRPKLPVPPLPVAYPSSNVLPDTLPWFTRNFCPELFVVLKDVKTVSPELLVAKSWTGLLDASRLEEPSKRTTACPPTALATSCGEPVALKT